MKTPAKGRSFWVGLGILGLSGFRVLGFRIGIFGAKEKPRYRDRGEALKSFDTKGVTLKKVSVSSLSDCAEQIWQIGAFGDFFNH